MKTKRLKRVVRRLAGDFENEAVACEKVEGKRNGDQAHAIRWCKKELLKAFAQPSNDKSSGAERKP